MGTFADTRDSRISVHMRQDGNLVQQDSVASVGSNFWNLTLVSLFKDISKYFRKEVSW